MDNVNKTLYIPLYGKAFVSRKNIILAAKMSVVKNPINDVGGI
jgi:hypothetical protein